MQQDLSNARIIEWESTEERGFEITCLVEVAHVARRERRGAKFREGGTYYTEEHAAKLGARVVAEFPRPSLAEVVGDAPAFLFTLKAGPYAGKRGYAVRELNGGWDWDLLRDAQHLHVGQLPPDSNIDVATVVPLFPREVVS